MSFLNKLFRGSNEKKSDGSHSRDTIDSIDLQKVFPRIKGLFDSEHLDPVQTSIEIQVFDNESPVIKPFAESLGICYMVDNGHSYEVVQNRHLSDDLTIEKLHEVALTNLATAISDKTQVNGDPKNIMMVTNGGNFEATMLLVDFLWEQLEPVFNDKICVAIPANDLLFIAGKNCLQGRETLRTLVRQYFDNKKTKGLIVRNIYERSNGTWTLLEQV